MDLRQLEYVVAVVDHGGFTKAAAAVHVAQPSLSQAIKALESELGVELFHRTSRSVVLTAAGDALVGPARQALRDAAVARAAVADVVGLAAGHLDIVSLPTLAVEPAAVLIGRFRQVHPGVSVRLVEPEDVDAVTSRVRSGTSEIAVTELPLPADDLVTHELGEQEYVALLPAGYASEVGAERVSLRSLAARPLVTTPAGTSTRRLVDESFAAAGVSVSVAVETDHREAIGALVESGAGFALVPHDLAARSPRDVILRRLTPRVSRRIGLVHRPGALSPAAHAFLGLALDGPADRRARPTPRRRSPAHPRR